MTKPNVTPTAKDTTETTGLVIMINTLWFNERLTTALTYSCLVVSFANRVDFFWWNPTLTESASKNDCRVCFRVSLLPPPSSNLTFGDWLRIVPSRLFLGFATPTHRTRSGNNSCANSESRNRLTNFARRTPFERRRLVTARSTLFSTLVFRLAARRASIVAVSHAGILPMPVRLVNPESGIGPECARQMAGV